MFTIPFNKPFLAGKELFYIAQSVLSGKISGDGVFSKKCHALMEKKFNAKKILLTTSCTSALEMAAILCDVKPGDEVILPSYTFVSTANAFYLRGAKLVFIDIRPDTLNIDESKIEAAVTGRTKVIVPVHYAGVGCEMDTIMAIAKKYNIFVVEDAAQGVNAKYKGDFLGTIGHLGAYSFHETKNFICGEGGAIVINDDTFIERAEIVREKGTNRSKYFRGQVDKYTWVDVGSSYLISDILAAFLFAQLEHMDEINSCRSKIFDRYYSGLSPLAVSGHLQLPDIKANTESNSHIFYVLLKDENTRRNLIDFLKTKNILSVFHYVPLHLSPVGRAMGYCEGSLPITESMSERLLRLPFYFELGENEQMLVIKTIGDFFAA
jgi:dTDP-4-amino-4,6-dideoxygalactose transaminase